MKIFAYLLIAISIAWAADAVSEQFSGHARAFSPGRGARIVEADRQQNPEDFKGIMAYQWIRASALFAGSLFLLSRIHRADKLDPFST